MRSKLVAMGMAGLAFLGLGVGAGLRVGLAQSGVGARVGEKLDDVGRGIVQGAQDLGGEIVQGAQDLGGAVRKRFETVRSDVGRMGVQPRVYSRLHWDKTLHNSRLEVHMLRDGVVLLRGVVPDAAARAHAVALVRDTHGVTGVVDELTTVVPTTSTPPGATGAAATTTTPGAATVPALTKPR